MKYPAGQKISAVFPAPDVHAFERPIHSCPPGRLFLLRSYFQKNARPPAHVPFRLTATSHLPTGARVAAKDCPFLDRSKWIAYKPPVRGLVVWLVSAKA